jgi:threonine synthase
MQIICDRCHQTGEFDPYIFRCACGGAWEPVESLLFDPASIDPAYSSVWRYRDPMGLAEIREPLSLGAGWTPLVDVPWGDMHTSFKLEYMAPSGSFKDRGTEVEANFLAAMGIRDVVEDSSGNAGASLAAYAARTGLHAAIYAPDSASPAKLAQIEVYGAELRRIPGPRSEATRAVLQAVEAGAVYASHAYNPAYLLGQQTFAWELWEQLGGDAPDVLVIPVGQGGLLLGAWLGFRRLLQAGLIARLPRLYAAQPEILAPIVHAFNAGAEEIEEITPTGKSLAEGLAIVKPVRGRRILQALHESGGAGLTVSEAQIGAAYYQLAENGLFAEPSSAAAAAALPQVRQLAGKNAKIIVALTGSGLKSPLEN